jgi:hypothetical protein
MTTVVVPASSSEILKRTLDTVRIRANSNGECFRGEITDALREAGVALGVCASHAAQRIAILKVLVKGLRQGCCLSCRAVYRSFR